MNRDKSPQRKPKTYLKEILRAVQNWVLNEGKFDFHPGRSNATLKGHIRTVQAFPVVRDTKIYAFLFLSLYWAEVTSCQVATGDNAVECVLFETGHGQKIRIGSHYFQFGARPAVKFLRENDHVKSMKEFLRYVDAWRTEENRWNIWPLE